MAATCRDWWRPCPCPRGSATPCMLWFLEGFAAFAYKMSEAALLEWGMRENIRLLTMFEVASLAWGMQNSARVRDAVPRTLCLDEYGAEWHQPSQPPFSCAAAFSSSTRSSPQGGRVTLGSSLHAGGMDGVVPGARRARPVERLFRGGADRAGAGAGF